MFISLSCSWVKRLYDTNYHERKMIPLELIKQTFGEIFKYHTNLYFRKSFVRSLPCFYQQIFFDWQEQFYTLPDNTSGMLNQFIWFNRYIKIGNYSIFFKAFSVKNVNFIINLFNNDGTIKKWESFRLEYDLQNNFHFQWMQIVSAIPKDWKDNIKNQSSLNF